MGVEDLCRGTDMGKKSRLKKERKLRTVGGVVFGTSKQPDILTRPVFRFFKKESEADALCNGKVWLSTLETCRKYENPLQGDPCEAMHTYRAGDITGGSSDSEFVEKLSRMGIGVTEGASNITITDGLCVTVINDAFVLCTTNEYIPETMCETFGDYCVEVSKPHVFFKEVADELNKVRKIKNVGYGLVQYKEREYFGLDAPPGPIGFVKPKDPYISQKEFRFLWEPLDNRPIEPFLLDCPRVAKLCRRIK